jgi:hypothetical protein
VLSVLPDLHRPAARCSGLKTITFHMFLPSCHNSRHLIDSYLGADPPTVWQSSTSRSEFHWDFVREVKMSTYFNLSPLLFRSFFFAFQVIYLTQSLLSFPFFSAAFCASFASQADLIRRYLANLFPRASLSAGFEMSLISFINGRISILRCSKLLRCYAQSSYTIEPSVRHSLSRNQTNISQLFQFFPV